MKKMGALSAVVVAVVAVGCGGPPKNAAMKEDLDALEQRMDKKLDESVLKIEKQLPGVKNDYLEMQTLQQQMKNTLEDLKKTDAKQALIRALKEEEKSLADRLASVRRLLEELQK